MNYLFTLSSSPIQDVVEERFDAEYLIALVVAVSLISLIALIAVALTVMRCRHRLAGEKRRRRGGRGGRHGQRRQSNSSVNNSTSSGGGIGGVIGGDEEKRSISRLALKISLHWKKCPIYRTRKTGKGEEIDSLSSVYPMSCQLYMTLDAPKIGLFSKHRLQCSRHFPVMPGLEAPARA